MNTTTAASHGPRNGPMTMVLSLGFVAFILVVVFSAMICQALPSHQQDPAAGGEVADTLPPPYSSRENPPPPYTSSA